MNVLPQMMNIPPQVSELFADPRGAKQRIQEYANSIKDDPMKEVQEKLNRGEINQQTYNMVYNLTSMLVKQMG